MKRHHSLTTGTAGVSAAALLMLTACGGAGGDGPEAWVLSGDGWPAVEEDFDRWNEQAEEGQQFNVESFENDAYKQQIRTVVGSGDAPTLIMSWTGGALLEYVENDLVLDLTDEVSGLEDRIHDSVWEAGAVEGSVYAVPLNELKPAVIYYNQSLLDEAGIEAPTTWAEVEEAVQALQEQDIMPFALAGSSVWPALMWLQYLTDRHGGEEVFQRVMAVEEGAWDQESIRFALETLQQMVAEGAFGENVNAVDAGQNEDIQLLADGQAAMLLQGSWVYPNFARDFPEFAESGDLGFTEFPVLEEGSGDPSNIVGNPANFWSVSADASEEEQQAALDYINNHLYNDEYIDSLLEQGSLPPVEGIEDRIAETDNADFLEFKNSLVAEANHFQLSWDQAVSPDHEQALIDNLAALLQEQITADEFIEAMNAL
ncbi:extracellular solute-binding protein [Nesterenkonia ebinurensis]|uniref:extracellular solute-binding protein n=1 Tax=Nesterenkonia ebinurensis TaxID=2608252 RepID=UPI00123D79DC|nr:extracellular solute-binding protein [Nesterenkonia ebinurensis]